MEITIKVFDNNFAWRFSNCDCSMSKTDPGTLLRLKQASWKSSEHFLVFIYYCHKEILLQCDVVPRSVSGLWLLQHIKSSGMVPPKKYYLALKVALPMSIWKEFLRKLEKHLWRGLFREIFRISDHSLIKVKFNADDLLEIWRRCWLHH